jgi:hypothetical protein
VAFIATVRPESKAVRRELEGQAGVDASWALANRGGGRLDREFMMGPRSRSSRRGSAVP